MPREPGWSFLCLDCLFASPENLQHSLDSHSTRQYPAQVALALTFFPSGVWPRLEYGTAATLEERFLSVGLHLFSQAYLQKTSQG